MRHYEHRIVELNGRLFEVHVGRSTASAAHVYWRSPRGLRRVRNMTLSATVTRKANREWREDRKQRKAWQAEAERRAGLWHWTIRLWLSDQLAKVQTLVRGSTK